MPVCVSESEGFIDWISLPGTVDECSLIVDCVLHQHIEANKLDWSTINPQAIHLTNAEPELVLSTNKCSNWVSNDKSLSAVCRGFRVWI